MELAGTGIRWGMVGQVRIPMGREVWRKMIGEQVPGSAVTDEISVPRS